MERQLLSGDEAVALAAVRAALPERLRAVNEKAFELGRKLAAERIGHS